MNEKKLMVVGCGGIGSRHLQALCKIDIPVKIFAVDTSEKSLKNAQILTNETTNSNIKSIQFSKELPDDIDFIDLCIIATSSNVRLTVLKKLVSKYSIKNLILEKVLFQSIRELDEAKDLINKEKIKCWINCPRREETFWRDMKKILSCYSGLNLYYGKSDWSMCCNSIHIIDLAVWLFNDKIRHLDNSNLNNDIHKSKREGFIEMTGILKGYFERDNTLTLEANLGIPREEATFEISGDEIRLIVNEDKGKGVLYKKENNWIPQEYDFHIPFQSEKTHKIAKKILENEECFLTKLEESVEIHKPLLLSFIKHLNKISKEKYDYCPIT